MHMRPFWHFRDRPEIISPHLLASALGTELPNDVSKHNDARTTRTHVRAPVPVSVRRCGEGRGCVPDEADREGSGSHTIDYV